MIFKWFNSLFALSEQEKELLAQIRRWPEGSYRIGERGSIFIAPKVVNSFPETQKAFQQAKEIVENNK